MTLSLKPAAHREDLAADTFAVGTLATARTPDDEAELQRIRAPVRDDLAAVDRVIVERLSSSVPLVNQISAHIVHSGGKRLRPLLVVLAARACGYQGEEHHTLAAVIEFIHTATLLHDDVVDDSSMRRGRATANVLFGTEASVLVGDFLYSRAFQMMVDIGALDVMRTMADTTNCIAEGEVLQLLNRGDLDTSESRYMQVIGAKTARLFEAAGEVGAGCAARSSDGDQRAALAAYGSHLGTAFQLVDDVLDYRGDAAQIGKNVGDDLAEGKATLPLIHALATLDDSDGHELRQAVGTGDGANIEDVLALIDKAGGTEYTMRLASVHAQSALDALAGLPASSERDSLEALAHFSTTRLA